MFLAGENPFQQEVREYPVDYGFPSQKKNTINIQIPDGYIEKVPIPRLLQCRMIWVHSLQNVLEARFKYR
jgi:hypothetical protein